MWLRAERQAAGRGRQGRQWQSPAGNLYASTLVRLMPTDPPAPTLALVAAVAAEEAIRSHLPDVARAGLRLKWPNDLLLDGAKLCGILLERVDDWVVVGVGVNVAHGPALPDRATASLAAAGSTASAAELLQTLAGAFADWLGRWRAGDLPSVVARWCERAHPRGTPLLARLPDGSSVGGTFDGLDATGALVLRLADGGARVIHAGDILLD